MKKLLLTIMACIGAFTAQAQEETATNAKEYTDQLVVTVDEYTTPPMKTTISVEEAADGTVNILLKNFQMELDGEPLPVGNIHVNDVSLTEEDGYNSFSMTDKHVTVTAGDDEDVLWYGPDLFPDGLDIDMAGKMTDQKFYCTLDLTFIDQVIHVVFGTDEFPSGIRSAQTANPNKLVDVYSILGVRVKSSVKQAEALDGLQRGIYIVDGKKVIKK